MAAYFASSVIWRFANAASAAARADGQQSTPAAAKSDSGPPQEVSARSDWLLDPSVGHAAISSAADSPLDLLHDRDSRQQDSGKYREGPVPEIPGIRSARQELQRRHPQHGAYAAPRRRHSREQHEERPTDRRPTRSSLEIRLPPFTQSTVTRIIGRTYYAACDRQILVRAEGITAVPATPKGRPRQTPMLSPVVHRKRMSAQHEWPGPRIRTSWSRARPGSTPAGRARPERLAKRISPGHTR